MKVMHKHKPWYFVTAIFWLCPHPVPKFQRCLTGSKSVWTPELGSNYQGGGLLIPSNGMFKKIPEGGIIE